MIIIENAYLYRRPFSPGNPVGRKMFAFTDAFQYGIGELGVVSGGKWVYRTGAPPPQYDVAAPGVVQNHDTSVGAPVAVTNPQLPMTIRAGYVATLVCSFSNFNSGIDECDVLLETNSADVHPRSFGIHGVVGGFCNVRAVDEGGSTIFDQSANVGFGAGVVPLGKHTLQVVCGPLVGTIRNVSFYLDGVLQATTTYSNAFNGSAFGIVVQSKVGDIGVNTVGSISIVGTST